MKLQNLMKINPDAAIAMSKKEKKAGKIVAIVTASFTIVYTPVMLQAMLLKHATITHHWVMAITHIVSCSVVIIDPMVYLFCSERFFNEIKNMLKSLYGKRQKVIDQLSRIPHQPDIQWSYNPNVKKKMDG